MDIFEALFTRRSIRKFTSQEVSDDDVTRMLDAAMAAPSAGNVQPWRFIVVRSATGRQAIADINPYAQMAPQSSVCIAVCADTTVERYVGYWPQDCSAALQNMLLAARGMGIGTVWTGVYPMEDRVNAFKALYKLPPHIMPLGVVVCGYPDQAFTHRSNYDAKKVFQEEWKN